MFTKVKRDRRQASRRDRLGISLDAVWTASFLVWVFTLASTGDPAPVPWHSIHIHVLEISFGLWIALSLIMLHQPLSAPRRGLLARLRTRPYVNRARRRYEDHMDTWGPRSHR